jgi:serine/threonine protein kinase
MPAPTDPGPAPPRTPGDPPESQPPTEAVDRPTAPDPNATAPLAAGEEPAWPDRVGRYRIEGEIARGGMGVVLRDDDFGRLLAVKVLRADLRNDPALERRFLEEARLTGQLQHPGVPPVHELGTLADGRPFFSMRLVKGRTLAELLQSRAAHAEDLPHLLNLFASVCQAVGYAHSRGVIHRDLKPANVMVGAFGEVQVMDWGLAKRKEEGGRRSQKAPGHLLLPIHPSSFILHPSLQRRAACWARRRTCPPSRPAARSSASTSAPTSSAWALSSARS